MQPKSGDGNPAEAPTQSVPEQDTLNVAQDHPQTTPQVPAESPAAVDVEEQELPPEEVPPAFKVSKETFDKQRVEDKELAQQLANRDARYGDPNARIADPIMQQVAPRYNVVQNQSDKVLVIPDVKADAEDMGLVLQPGEMILLTDFYSPQQINRSRGLRYAATIEKGIGDKFALVPLKTEEEGAAFVVPKKKQRAPGETFEDPDDDNPFDARYAELEAREAKRDAKLIKKTLASRKQKQHGAVSHV